jgi:transcriptional regulator with GAF, ATPase, and Fis domain
MRTRLEKLESLLELPVILGGQGDFQEILRLISVRAAALFEAEVASLVMINPRTRETVKTVIKEGRDANERHYRLAQTNIIGWSLHHRQPFLSPDLKTDSRFSAGLFQKSPVKSAMCVPLQIEADDIGYIVVINKLAEGEFDEDDLGLLARMAAIVAPYLSNAQKLQEFFNTPLPDAALLARFEALGLVGQSKPFVEMLRAVDAAAHCDVRVALQGQSGTGKELVANAIHHFSARKHMPFIALDCGAIPENLVESELFGHVKGAFTGANQDRKGLLEEAHGGTLFMDEVGNLPVDMQAKFMRASRAKSGRWAAIAPGRSTCASSPRRARPCSSSSRKKSSAKICTIACTCIRSSFPRCMSAATIFRFWPSACCKSSPRSKRSRSRHSSRN